MSVAPPVDVDDLDSAYLDCVANNVQAMLRHAGVRDVRAPVAREWHFGFDSDDGRGLPSPILERTPLTEKVRATTGFDLCPLDGTPDSVLDVLRERIAAGYPVLVVGDAFAMPWLPYFEKEHMTHSFVVDAIDETGVALIGDAYENKTRWGSALPVRASVPASDIPAMLSPAAGWLGARMWTLERAERLHDADDQATIAENSGAIIEQIGRRAELRGFRDFYATRADDLEAVQAFTLGCWLAMRSRCLHALWLRDVSDRASARVSSEALSTFDERVVAPWRRATEFSYLMERRVAAGRAAPLAGFDLMEDVIEPGEIAAAEELARAS